jgi:hypothetical protein
MAYSVTTSNSSLEFDTRLAEYNSCIKMDTNHFINVWRGGANFRGIAQAFVVNTSTFAVTTAGDSFEFDTTQATSELAVYIDATHFLVFDKEDYSGFGRGQVQVFAVSTTT